MGDTVDPVTILQINKPGMAMCCVNHFRDSAATELTWLLRVDTEQLRRITAVPDVEIRADAFYREGVCLIPVLIRLGSGPNEEYIFETWLNSEQKGEDPIALLAAQDRIILQLYGDSGTREEYIEVGNALQNFAKKLLAEKDSCSWTLSEFEAAKESMYREFPDVGSLWENLERRE